MTDSRGRGTRLRVKVLWKNGLLPNLEFITLDLTCFIYFHILQTNHVIIN